MPRPITGKPQLNRVVNRTLILDRIRRDGHLSRAELAKITAIRPPTVSAVIRELIEEGLRRFERAIAQLLHQTAPAGEELAHATR